jgi:hypothetical protein
MTTMKIDSSIHSEEDVRTKVVFPWLLSHGFDPDQLSLEHTFSVRLGRTVVIAENGTTRKTTTTRNKQNKESDHKTFSGRADILVRNAQGRNLIIVEVKAPHIRLDDGDRDQAISYARLLEGNIAPIAVVTNGEMTKVFDTITRTEIVENSIDIRIRCENAQLLAGQNDRDLRAAALESLLSLSKPSLLAFCEGQIDYRMRPLYSDDLYSGKKFIPALYVGREKVQENLDRLLDHEKRPVVVLVGSPQVGKTNFVCHAVRERLKRGAPALFYPAIGLRNGLLSSILEDFEWGSEKDVAGAQTFLGKLKDILRRSNKRLVIFIDGWNEANLSLARQIDAEGDRLLSENIQIVISLTDIAAKRLLLGPAGNSSALAEGAAIHGDGGQLLEIAGEAGKIPAHWSVVRVGRYSRDECETAYDVYKNAYAVTVPATHQKVLDPYMLGAAMKLYQSKTLPDHLDEPDLLRRLIDGKTERAIGFEELNMDCASGLTSLAQKMLADDAPVSVLDTNRLWNVPLLAEIPNGFFEAALLAAVRNDMDQPAIDFYYGKERDYVIAYRVCGWAAKLARGANLEEEFGQAAQTDAGYESLQWFFRQPAHMARFIELQNGIPNFVNPVIRRVLISALCHLAPRFLDEYENWLDLARSYLDNDTDSLVIIECVKLVSILAEDPDEVSSILGKDGEIKDRVRAMLSVSEDYPLSMDGVGRVILDALSYSHETEDSEITRALRSLLSDPLESMQKNVAICLGYVDWRIYFEMLSKEILTCAREGRPFEKLHLWAGLEEATDGISEGYYGSMCPGMLEALREDDEGRQEEYRQLTHLLTPVLNQLGSADPHRQTLEELLDAIRGDTSAAPGDPYTLPLPF